MTAAPGLLSPRVVPASIPPGESLFSLLPIHGILSAFFSALTGWVLGGTAHFIAALGASLQRASHPNFGSGFLQAFHEVGLIGAGLAFPFLLLAVVQAILRQDVGIVLRAAFVRLPAALILGAGAAGLVSSAIGVTDEWCNALVAHGGASLQELVGRLVSLLGGGGVAGQAAGVGFAQFALGLVAMAVALLLWLELVVRSAAISVATLFLPLVLAGLVWSATAQWARRLAETLAALIVAKLVVVGVLVLAADSALQGHGLTALGNALALLLMAVLAPFAVLRLIPIVESGAVGHFEGLGRRSALAGMSAVGSGREAVARALARAAGPELDPVLARMPVADPEAPSGRRLQDAIKEVSARDAAAAARSTDDGS